MNELRDYRLHVPPVGICIDSGYEENQRSVVRHGGNARAQFGHTWNISMAAASYRRADEVVRD